jgi:hypothetical protein
MERRLVVSPRRIVYEGYFKAQDVYRIIQEWLLEHGYDIDEKRNEEFVRPQGKQTLWISENPLKINDYVQYVINIVLLKENLVDRTIEIDGKQRNTQHGKITITLRGFLETDYERRWESKAWRWYLRMMVDKYFLKTKMRDEGEELKEQVSQFGRILKDYFNMQKDVPTKNYLLKE